jgi:hypothetical protein
VINHAISVFRREPATLPDFIFDIPIQKLAIYISLITIGSMFVGLIIFKPILRLLFGSGPEFNQNLGIATSGFGLFYGLLLGLLTVSAYQNSERIKEGIMAEATSLGALYADMNSYPEPMRSDMKAMMRDYVLFTVNKDWDAHRRGNILNGGFTRVDAMRQKLTSFEPETNGQEIVHGEVVGSFQRFTEARQQRLTGLITALPDVLWYAVLVGAIVNVLLIVILRMPLLQQFFLGTISVFFLGVMLFVIVVLDRPLRGEAGLGPEPLQLLWERAMVWDEPQS